MPQKRSGATAGLEESRGSAGGAECSVTACRARCHASSQLPDRLRARGRTTMARTAPATVPRVLPTRLSRRAVPLRDAPSAVRAPSASTPRRRRSPRAILARRSASWELREAAKVPGVCLASPARAQRRVATDFSAATAFPGLLLRFRLLPEVQPRYVRLRHRARNRYRRCGTGLIIGLAPRSLG